LTLSARGRTPTGTAEHPTMSKVAPPVKAARFPTGFPGVATFIIVGPEEFADVNGSGSNNIEDGTLRRTCFFSGRCSAAGVATFCGAAVPAARAGETPAPQDVITGCTEKSGRWMKFGRQNLRFLLVGCRVQHLAACRSPAPPPHADVHHTVICRPSGALVKGRARYPGLTPRAIFCRP
jgi:hypothetical protein